MKRFALNFFLLLHSLTLSRLLVRTTHGCPSSRLHPSSWSVTALHGLLPHKLPTSPFRSIYSSNLHNIPYGRELRLIVCRKRTWFQAFQPIISPDTHSSWMIRNSNHSAFTCLQTSPPPAHRHYFASNTEFHVLLYYLVAHYHDTIRTSWQAAFALVTPNNI